MAMKSKSKTEEKTEPVMAKKVAIPRKMTTVSFRTEKLLKEKAEAVFADLGVTTSAAINMFLKQVVRERGLPFQPSAKSSEQPESTLPKSVSGGNSLDLALEELWNEI